jgi:hypothetical protein
MQALGIEVLLLLGFPRHCQRLPADLRPKPSILLCGRIHRSTTVTVFDKEFHREPGTFVATSSEEPKGLGSARNGYK